MNHFKEIYISLRDEIFDALDAASLVDISYEELERQLRDSIDLLIDRKQFQVSTLKREELVKALTDELKGLGPLESLLSNDNISDIMINGPNDVFIEVGVRLKSPTFSLLMRNSLILSPNALHQMLEEESMILNLCVMPGLMTEVG